MAASVMNGRATGVMPAAAAALYLAMACTVTLSCALVLAAASLMDCAAALSLMTSALVNCATLALLMTTALVVLSLVPAALMAVRASPRLSGCISCRQ